MSYVIEAEERSGKAASKIVNDRKEALAVAVEWNSRGHEGIRIVGDGRTYLPKELAWAIIHDEPR